jgi:hypothetical protein
VSPKAASPHPLSFAPVAKTVLLALFAIGAAAWGLVRHYTVRAPPFYVAAPAATSETMEAPALEEDAAP